MPTAAEQAIERLQAMSPANRAFQLFTGTIANAGNKATAGALGAAGDLVRGTPWGTTSDQLNAQLNSAAPTAAAVSDAIGQVAGLKGLGGLYGAGKAALPAVGGVARTAAALEASAGKEVAAKFAANTAGPGLVPYVAPSVSKGAALKGAGILGMLGLAMAGRQDDTTAAAPAAKTGYGLQLDGGVKETGPAPAREPTTQERSLAAIDTILRGPFTIDDFQAATGALPGVAAVSTKVSNKDKVFGTASGIADTLYQTGLAQAAELTGKAKDAAILKATQDYRQNLLETLNVDPSKAAAAEAIAAAQAAKG